MSIVLPTYQRGALIGRAIRSVLAQTFTDFELVVVDDGSTDDTAAVVAGFDDPRLRYLQLDANRGAAAARNAGIRHAAAPLLAFQDSDDEWLPDKLERHLHAFATCGPEVGLVYSDMQRIHRDGAATYHRSPDVVRGGLLDAATRFYQVCGLGIQSTVIRRECLDAVGGFDEALPALEDLELFIRLSRQCEFHRLAEPLVLYHETDGLSRDVPAKIVARTRLLELYGPDLERAEPGFVAREREALAAARRRVVDVSICICTYRRPAGLQRLLRSLGRLDAATPPHEIIVVDNDAAMSAEPAVRTAQAEGLRVQYVVEPQRGIARARNRAVAPARGEFVAFIDDDEEADPRWLAALYGEVLRHGADGGIGPVLPRFNPHTPAWLIEGEFFDRPRPPTGTRLHATGMRTGNALIRRRQLMALRGPFDERYALTGGEDTDMFLRLVDAGCRIVAVDDAIVHEHLPPHRTTVGYLLRRRFLAGMGSARVYSSREAAVQPHRERARWLASGLALGVTGLALFPASRTHGLARLTIAARNLGRFAFYSGFSYEPYGSDSWR